MYVYEYKDEHMYAIHNIYKALSITFPSNIASPALN